MSENTINGFHAGARQGRHARSPQEARCCARICATALGVCLVLAGGHLPRAQASPSTEYQVKAAFLLNFAKFVEWPAEAFQSEEIPISLCVFRHDPFGSILDEIIKGKTIHNRKVLAQRITEPQGLKLCHLVFVSSREAKLLPSVLNSLRGASALVVGESDNFAAEGGGFQLYLEDNTVHFRANVDALQRARLTVSSKLLALAKIVRDQAPPKGN